MSHRKFSIAPNLPASALAGVPTGSPSNAPTSVSHRGHLSYLYVL